MPIIDVQNRKLTKQCLNSCEWRQLSYIKPSAYLKVLSTELSRICWWHGWHANRQQNWELFESKKYQPKKDRYVKHNSNCSSAIHTYQVLQQKSGFKWINWGKNNFSKWFQNDKWGENYQPTKLLANRSTFYLVNCCYSRIQILKMQLWIR